MNQAQKKCSVEGCDRPFSGKGYCGVHYQRMYRAGRLSLIRRENGTGNINKDGYVDIRVDKVRVYQHVHVAETALGRSLPKGACVHHVDENKANNANSNLVICPSEAYHKLLHRRMKAMDACGNPNFKRCPLCGKWDDPANLHRQNSHLECLRTYARERYRRKTGNVF